MPELSADVRTLFDGANFATVTSLNADGSPQASVVWVKTDGDDIVFSTVRGRRKDRNFARDPRTTIVVVDHANPYRYAEVRGKVTVTEDPTGGLIDELSHKYTGKSWAEAHPGVERLIVRVIPERVYLRG
ncbi:MULTISPECIES: PPOX class F420-dependent oxidoreductase [Streptosporangium]|uniref:PPOX class probable F420-dependent enzyme n=1 Tax=Streptosporangium brasiliense TaxID=47480 RepID=A0ABT9R1Q1_9ACTN|nr:PPOX class F420-dependent oxidoreductase [Streptosporangium brasiliense]MDP9863159.1 PPOX class probable F420-dependent enzyme [Streptosporangium brasiliense]